MSHSASVAPRVLMIVPRFNPNSFWSADDVLDILGALYPAPPLGLITLAALLPKTWDVRLVDRNVQELTPSDLASADIVMTGGMLPQQPDLLELIGRCKRDGIPVCVGGPAPTSSPHVFAAADFLVLGEAEGVIDEFVAAWERGERQGRFEAVKFQADVAKSPVPRFDLLDFGRYMQLNVQFSRGCPFTCEFCDIIELYGRVPRTKTDGQMLAELDALYELGYRGHVDFVDDNLIGNKKAVKRFLPVLHAWQFERGYPFRFSTEASINLADDADLLEMMRKANFFAVFVGVESPDPETLIHTQKKQNTRRSISESIHRIQAAGIYVLAGLIVGFDTERAGSAAAMLAFAEEADLPLSMVGLLTALPNTQLTRRLHREGRLYADYDEVTVDSADQYSSGLNFETARPRREVLADYRLVLDQIYEPRGFYKRVCRMAMRVRRPFLFGRGSTVPVAVEMRQLLRLCWKSTISQPRLARHFWPALLFCFRHTNWAGFYIATMNMALFLHVHRLSRRVVRSLDRQIADIDAGRAPHRPILLTVPEEAVRVTHKPAKITTARAAA